jgi:hypothetical protein
MALRDSLRARRAECPARTRLANITGPASDRSGVPHRFRYASYANPRGFRIPEIWQRGPPPAPPVELRSLPPPPCASQIVLYQHRVRWFSPQRTFIHCSVSCTQQEATGSRIGPIRAQRDQAMHDGGYGLRRIYLSPKARASRGGRP